MWEELSIKRSRLFSSLSVLAYLHKTSTCSISARWDSSQDLPLYRTILVTLPTKYVLLLAYIDSNFVRLVLFMTINVEVVGEALKIYFLDFVSEFRNQPSELRVLFPLLILCQICAHTMSGPIYKPKRLP